MTRFLTWIFAVLVLASVLPSVAQAAPPVCGCKDKRDLVNRVREARAAIKAYEQLIAKHGDESHGWRFGKFYETDIQPNVQKAINGVSDMGANRMGGSTDPSTCDRNPNKIMSGSKHTACLGAVIDRHEQVHGAACKKWKDGSYGQLRKPDYRGAKGVKAALEEEIDAYNTEIAFIKQQIDAACPLGWKVDVDVMIHGQGSKATNDLSHIEWKVMHRYKGSVELTVGPVPTASLADGSNPTPAQLISGEFTQVWQPAAPGGGKMASVPLQVEIDDSISNYIKDPGEGQTYEATTNRTTWKGKGADKTHGVGSLVVDEARKLHELVLEVKPSSTTKQLDVVEKEIIDRTPYGYGDAPTHEEKTLKKTKEPFSVMTLPVIANVLDGHAVTTKKKPMQLTNGSFKFEGTFKAPPGYLANLPDVANKLKIVITYRVTKIEL